MDRVPIYKITLVALLALGSAILLISCKDKTVSGQESLERLMTQQSDTLTIFNSVNGKIKYRFDTPLMERYEYARQPYMEFREGIDITTYNDSTMNIESTLRADYALFLESQQLWEAKGNVVATNAGGQKLETQQLFWNQKTKRIYSNIDSKITDGTTEIIGQGFESDEEFKDWVIRRPTGRLEVDVEPTQPAQPAHSSQTQPEEGEGNGNTSQQIPVNPGPAAETADITLPAEGEGLASPGGAGL